MSGRRVRTAVKAAIDAKTGRSDATVVIAGLSNAYADYTTTFEEFQAQRYEGGSTIYGPHQLQAYTQIAVQLATAIATNTSVPAGTQPLDYSDKVRFLAHRFCLLALQMPLFADFADDNFVNFEMT